MSDLVGKHITDAMERGEFDNLPGAGKPLRLEADRLVPAENRLAYKIMRDNDVVPDWIGQAQLIEREFQLAQQKIQRAARHFRTAQSTLQNRKDITSIRKRLDAEDEWKAAQEQFKEALHLLNKKVANFNLIVPAVHLTRNLYDIEQEIRQIQL